MKKEKDIWTLSANYLSGEMTGEQSLKFKNTLIKEPVLNAEFINIKNTWNTLSKEELPESEKSWDKLHSRLKKDGLLENHTDKRNAWKVYFYSAAAIIITGLIVGITLRYNTSDINLPFNNTTSLTAFENVNSYTLPDGSKVYLNKGSKLIFSDNFGENREVKLKGEGFFEVMADSENPFLIETGNAHIRVIGTQFNVKENQNATEVLVESGTVQLKRDLKSEGIRLSKGDFGKSDGRTESMESNSNINYLSWKTLEFKFSDTDLQEVLSVLEKSYHISISVEDVEINNLKLSSSYNHQSIDSIIKTICVAFDLACEHKENAYSLRKNN